MSTRWEYDCTCFWKLANEMTWLKACFDPNVSARRINLLYCTADLCLSVDKLKKEKKKQQQGRNNVSVQRSVSMLCTFCQLLKCEHVTPCSTGSAVQKLSVVTIPQSSPFVPFVPSRIRRPSFFARDCVRKSIQRFRATLYNCCRHFRTIWQQTVDNSPTDPISSSFNWWSSRHGPCQRTKVEMLASGLTKTDKFFCCPGRNPWFEDASFIIPNILANLTFSLSTTQFNMVKEWCWLAQIDFFHEYFPHWVNVSFLPSQFYIVHIHWQE